MPVSAAAGERCCCATCSDCRRRKTAQALATSVEAPRTAPCSRPQARSAASSAGRETGRHRDTTTQVDLRLLEQYVRAFEEANFDALVALFHEVACATPCRRRQPGSRARRQRALHRRMFGSIVPRQFLHLRIAANGQPALAFYRPRAAGAHAVPVSDSARHHARRRDRRPSTLSCCPRCTRCSACRRGCPTIARQSSAAAKQQRSAAIYAARTAPVGVCAVRQGRRAMAIADGPRARASPGPGRRDRRESANVARASRYARRTWKQKGMRSLRG